jgi:hypothetical protein
MSEPPADPRSAVSRNASGAPSGSAPVPFHGDLDAETVFAILGAARRSGEWTPPELLRVVAIMGGVVLDFRDAHLPHGVTEVWVFALMGGVTITVPKDIDLDVTAHAVLGGIDHHPAPTGDAHGAEHAQKLPRERPLLVVSGIAVMGGITIRIV